MFETVAIRTCDFEIDTTTDLYLNDRRTLDRLEIYLVVLFLCEETSWFWIQFVFYSVIIPIGNSGHRGLERRQQIRVSVYELRLR